MDFCHAKEVFEKKKISRRNLEEMSSGFRKNTGVKCRYATHDHILVKNFCLKFV